LATILNIETATNVCSVALGKDGQLLSIKESAEERSHASQLTVLIQEVLGEAGLGVSDLNAIAVSKGPGSYTGLRIGVSAAKGLCYSLDIPLIAVDTLQAMANSFVQSNTDQIEGNTLLCPMIDARRMEVYCAVYDSNLKVIDPVSAKIIDGNSFSGHLDKGKVLFFGDGAEKCKVELEDNNNADFDNDLSASASGMISLSENLFNNKAFEDVAYFEPYYLKDFVAGKPKAGS